jgi:hypothetical protein
VTFHDYTVLHFDELYSHHMQDTAKLRPEAIVYMARLPLGGEFNLELPGRRGYRLRWMPGPDGAIATFYWRNKVVAMSALMPHAARLARVVQRACHCRRELHLRYPCIVSIVMGEFHRAGTVGEMEASLMAAYLFSRGELGTAAAAGA